MLPRWRGRRRDRDGSEPGRAGLVARHRCAGATPARPPGRVGAGRAESGRSRVAMRATIRTAPRTTMAGEALLRPVARRSRMARRAEVLLQVVVGARQVRHIIAVEETGPVALAHLGEGGRGQRQRIIRGAVRLPGAQDLRPGRPDAAPPHPAPRDWPADGRRGGRGRSRSGWGATTRRSLPDPGAAARSSRASGWLSPPALRCRRAARAAPARASRQSPPAAP